MPWLDELGIRRELVPRLEAYRGLKDGTSLRWPFLQELCDVLVGLFYRIGRMEISEIPGPHGSVFHQGFEIDHVGPEARAEEYDGHAFFHLQGLHQRQQFEEFIEGAETARHDDYRLGHIGEPVFPHEEVVEFEGQLGADVAVLEFFGGNGDGEADRASTSLVRAAVRRLHDARPATGADNIASRA